MNNQSFDIDGFARRLNELCHRIDSLAQIVQQNYSILEQALDNGVTQAQIVQLFMSFGVPMTLPALKSGLRRARESRGLVSQGSRFKRSPNVGNPTGPIPNAPTQFFQMQSPPPGHFMVRQYDGLQNHQFTS